MEKNNRLFASLIMLLGIIGCASCIVFLTMENRKFTKVLQSLVRNPTIEMAKMKFVGHSETFTKFDRDILRARGLKIVPDNVSTQKHHVLFVTWAGIPQQRIFVFYEPENSNVVAIGHAKW